MVLAHKNALKVMALMTTLAALALLLGRLRTAERDGSLKKKVDLLRMHRDKYNLWTSDEHSQTANLKLPYPNATRPVEEIIEAPWIALLQSHLASLNSSYVSLCLCDSRYTESLLNWLISASVKTHPPLENILIISLSGELHEILTNQGIFSVFIDPWTVLQGDVQLPTNFSHIWSVRMVVLRLMNHWGYSVATYDSDAITVRNPRSMFDTGRDLVGSRGVYPFKLRRIWKSPTFCMGVTFFRATSNMGIVLYHICIIYLDY